MDYDFSASQQRVIATVDRVIDASGGIERAFALAVAAGYDRELDRALADAGVLDGSDLLEDECLERDSMGNGQLKTAMIAGLGGGSVEVQLNTIARALLGPGR